MTVLKGIMYGLGVCYTAIVTDHYLYEKKCNYYNAIVDTHNNEVIIKCNARGISVENFKVYTRLENGRNYLYIRGAELLDDCKDFAKVKHKYYLGNISAEDLHKTTFSKNEDELMVKIPLSNIDRKIKVKRVMS